MEMMANMHVSFLMQIQEHSRQRPNSSYRLETRRSDYCFLESWSSTSFGRAEREAKSKIDSAASYRVEWSTSLVSFCSFVHYLVDATRCGASCFDLKFADSPDSPRLFGLSPVEVFYQALIITN